jgi:pyrroline-5-carboxylate reductase
MLAGTLPAVMQVGLIGAGNMASALARGWGDPVLAADPLPGRAQALADELGGQALDSNLAVAEQADLVILAHKPAQLEEVAAEIAGTAKRIVSILGATPLASVQAAYPDTPVFRVLPNVPVEVRQGVLCVAKGTEPDEEIVALFERVGRVVRLDDSLIDVAMGLMSVAPAYVALAVEAQVDAGVRHGLPPDIASELVVGTTAGTAALLDAKDHDTLSVRRSVTSPGGSTARGLRALEQHGLRHAYHEALDAVLEGR